MCRAPVKNAVDDRARTQARGFSRRFEFSRFVNHRCKAYRPWLEVVPTSIVVNRSFVARTYSQELVFSYNGAHVARARGRERKNSLSSYVESQICESSSMTIFSNQHRGVFP